MEESQLVDVPVDFTGGLDEISPGPDVAQSDYLKLTNWRLTKDGRRIEKRLGLTDFGATEAAQILALMPGGLGEDIYGFTTYYNATPVFCKLLVTESQVLRKVSTGAWASIHTFASTLAHPIRVLEIQGKQFIIHENDSRVVHTDGNDYQIGITAPTTVPTLTATTGGNLVGGAYRYAVMYGRGGNYGTESNPIKSKVGTATYGLCTYTTVGGEAIVDGGVETWASATNLTSWTEILTGTSSINRESVSPHGGTYCARLDIDASNSEARLIQGWFTLSSGITYTISLWYKNSTTAKTSHLRIYSGGGYFLNSSAAWVPAPTTIVLPNVTVWTNYTLSFTPDTHSTSCYYEFASGGGYSTGTSSSVYVDDISISATVSTYEVITWGGAGLNDCTASGTYTGNENIDVRVQIDAVGNPDTVKISYDEGETWAATGVPITSTMYLNDGIILTWAATTGHTINTLWQIACSACAVTTVGGYINQPVYTPTTAVGLNDITVTGPYTLNTLYHIRVEIDAAGGQDTFKYSNDNGSTWIKITQNVKTTDIKLGYGIKVKWGAITGHTSGDYWTFDIHSKQIGPITFHHPTGQLNDLTTSGTYTGQNKSTVKILLSTAAATDKIDISYDNGATWAKTGQLMTATMTLAYGIILTWGATTTHTANDYWTFICETGQQVTLTGIPISGDPQVTYRDIYRTVINGASYYWLTRLNDNTTTTFLDNIPDSLLGSLMEEDHDVLPKGKFSAWWDNRLWVSGSNKIYYSGIDKPEQFNVGYDYIDIRAGAQGDDITQMFPYQDNMYVFTRNSIYLIQQRVSGIYGRFSVRNDLGCVAPFSMVEANGILYFMSERGIEAFNGTEILPRPASLPITRTVQTLDTAKYDYICASHNFLRNEIWWSIPDATGSTTTNKAIVLNYGSGKFYVFDFHKIISFLGPARDSNKSTQIYLGTRDGLIYTADTGYLDGATAITATLRKGWWDLQKYGSVRKIILQYEAPAGKTLTVTSYVNFDKDAFNTKTLTGITPTSTDLEMRRVVDDNWDVDCRGQFYAIEITNAENVGGDLKINHMILKVRADVKKAKIFGD